MGILVQYTEWAKRISTPCCFFKKSLVEG